MPLPAAMLDGGEDFATAEDNATRPRHGAAAKIVARRAGGGRVTLASLCDLIVDVEGRLSALEGRTGGAAEAAGSAGDAAAAKSTALLGVPASLSREEAQSVVQLTADKSSEWAIAGSVANVDFAKAFDLVSLGLAGSALRALLLEDGASHGLVGYSCALITEHMIGRVAISLGSTACEAFDKVGRELWQGSCFSPVGWLVLTDMLVWRPWSAAVRDQLGD